MREKSVKVLIYKELVKSVWYGVEKRNVTSALHLPYI